MPPSQWARSQEHFCSRQCHMAKMNPTRMTKEVRQKLALNTGKPGTRTGSWAARCFPVKDLKTFACSARQVAQRKRQGGGAR